MLAGMFDHGFPVTLGRDDSGVVEQGKLAIKVAP